MEVEIGESSSQQQKEEKLKQAESEQKAEEKIPFLCSICKMSEHVHYFGKHPPFVKNIEFVEDCYILRDPFSPPPTRNGKKSFSEYFITIGSHCVFCEEAVCKDCGIFYSKTFCYRCAYDRVQQFPLEVQSKIRKEYLAIKNR